MSRPRLPEQVAKVTGADRRSPGRFKGRKTPKVKSLGPPPKRFTPEQAEIWKEFNDDFPWLGRSDRRTVGLAVLLQDQIDKSEGGLMVGEIAQMRMLLSAMGGTPVDRSKVTIGEDEDPDPADAFLN